MKLSAKKLNGLIQQGRLHSHRPRQSFPGLQRWKRAGLMALALVSFCCASLAMPSLAAHRANASYPSRSLSSTASLEAGRYSPQLGLKLALTQPDQALLSAAASESSNHTGPAAPAALQPAALQEAQELNREASHLFSHGNAEAALIMWRDAQAKYAQAQDQRGVLGSQINQAQALQTIGLYNRAHTLMEDLQNQLQGQADPDIKALGLHSLGSILQATGYLKQSQTVLEEALTLAQTHQLDSSALHITLGNTLRALKDPKAAIAEYNLAASSHDGLVRLEAQLNQLSLQVDQGQWKAAKALLPQLKSQFQGLAPSRRTIYGRVNLASSVMQMLEQQGKLGAAGPSNNAIALMSSSGTADPGLKATGKSSAQLAAKREGLDSSQGVAKQLAIAVEQARQLKDARAESYALGELGTLYEQTGQWNDAAQLTRQALRLAQTNHAPDVAYRWQWQMGRITTKSNNKSGDQNLGQPISPAQRQEAIAAYRDAVTTLRSIRSDLVATNPEIQFSFRESVEPVYRELMSLLIQPDSSEAMLTEARDAIEELQLAELENFFRSACLDVTSQKIDAIDRSAAVFYPIILSDRLEVLVSIPGEPLSHHSVAIGPKHLERTLDNWLQSLTPIASSRRQRQLSSKLYDWLVRPAHEKLQAHGIETLVFVPDGPLRNLPMAALYDGDQYLVENYQVALTPGLQLLEPRALGQEQLQALSVGLTESRQGFSALPGVQQEIEQIQASVPSKVVLDKAFTKENLQRQLKDSTFPIVHLATHGQFSSDPEQTFLLTWDTQINVREIRNLLKSRRNSQTKPIELLVLSACQTAAGDSQAALGLAGLAVQSGARSTLATLWSVNDRSTAKLMTELYQDLAASDEISRGASLRQAQLALLHSEKYNHPFYWSAFVLVGNWL